MIELLNCVYCHTQPERTQGNGWGNWIWYATRCENPLCIQHGTVRHLTRFRADTRLNTRQLAEYNILRNARKVQARL